MPTITKIKMNQSWRIKELEPEPESKPAGKVIPITYWQYYMGRISKWCKKHKLIY